MKKRLLSALLLFVIPLLTKAQFVDFGQDPASLRWKQINTPDFQIIYPDFFEKNAQKIANIYAALYRHSNSLAHKPVKISMVVHPNGGISNGSVAWAPRKSDLYTMPQQDPSDNWLEHLCVHEFRHVVQIDKVNQGLTKILYYLFGEQVTIAVTGLYLPVWFMEGDAVAYETAIGHLGRGRSPEFLNEMKAQVVEKGIYSYYKAALGSYKDFVPNRYTFGYFMVANSRLNYGNDIWSDALNRIGRHPLSLAPFTRSLRKTLEADRNRLWDDSVFRSLFIDPDRVKKANTYRDAKRTLYHDNFSELQQIWKNEIRDRKNAFDTIPTHNRAYTGYYYPTPTKEGAVVAFKKGLQQTGAFVLLKNGEETLLTRTGILSDYKFALNGPLLVWTEYRPHTRWEHGGRMTLVSYDLIRKKYRYHKSRNNRFSPFSLGDKWGVIEVDPNNRASIVILDAGLKKEIGRITANPDELFLHPSFENNRIYTVVQNSNGIQLESIDPADGSRQKLSSPCWYEIDNPVSLDSALIFRASFDGNNAFYSQDLKKDVSSKILEARFGLRFPTLNPATDSLYFSFYTADGYKPGKISLHRLKRQAVDRSNFRLADSLTEREHWKLQLDTDSVFESKRYRKFTHLINFHSWGPWYINPSEREINGGIVAYSQNKLSTFFLSGGYIFNSDYDHGAWLLNATYKGIWPIFSADFKSGRNQYYNLSTRMPNLQTHQNDTVGIRSKANYTQLELSMQLPFNLSVKNYNRFLTPYVRYKIESVSDHNVHRIYRYTIREDTLFNYPGRPENYRFSLPSNFYQMMEYGIIFNNQTRMTEQEINPRWGQILQAGYAHTPWEKLNFGEEWWISGAFYFPGFFRNHSFSVYGGHQNRPKNGYYGKKILAARGTKLYGHDLSTLRTDYQLPLFYPDQHITPVLYIKAVNGGAFFDMSRDEGVWGTGNYYSYGAEFNADCHVFRLPAPVNVGFRVGYETQKKSVFADFLFSVGFSW